MEKGNLKNKAKEAAMDALGLNDTSVDARLYLNGKEYPIDTFDIQFQESFDFKGEPQREVKGGLMSIGFNQVVDEQLNYWMFHPEVYYSGSVVFASFSRIANPVIIIEFVKARCVKYSKNIDPSLSLNILITAQKIKVNGMGHKNNPKY
ncbi:hypothetical protein AGMMS50239_13300 [Bacteroidia bacterium]|nr:hypothetical protein AGMMS50239_13300 [Bacteroidia bacterium]